VSITLAAVPVKPTLWIVEALTGTALRPLAPEVLAVVVLVLMAAGRISPALTRLAETQQPTQAAAVEQVVLLFPQLVVATAARAWSSFARALCTVIRR